MLLLIRKKIIFVLLVLFIFGCDNFQDIKTVDEKGSITFTIPSVSSSALDLLLDRDIKKDKLDSKSRALIAADFIEYTVYSGTEVAETGSSTIDGQFYGEITIQLAPGTYTMVVDVFNTDNSITEPVVTASSSTFSVTSGTISDVYMTAIPNSAVAITEADSLVLNSSDFIDTIVNIDTGEVSLGSEQWYSFTATSDNVSVIMDFTEGEYSTEFAIWICDENGHIITQLQTIENTYGVLSNAAGQTYYLGILYADFSDITTGNPLETMTLRFEEYVPVVEDAVVGPDLLTGYAASNVSSFYRYQVTPGSDYIVSFDANYTDMNLFVYSEDESEVYFSNYVYDQASTIITPGADVTSVIVEISGDYDSGSFDLMFNEYIIVIEDADVSTSWIIGSVEYQQSVFYRFQVTAEQNYEISINESAGVQYSDVRTSVYSEDGSEFYINSVDYLDNGEITPSAGVTSIIVEVNGYYTGGDFGLQFQETLTAGEGEILVDLYISGSYENGSQIVVNFLDNSVSPRTMVSTHSFDYDANSSNYSLILPEYESTDNYYLSAGVTDIDNVCLANSSFYLYSNTTSISLYNSTPSINNISPSGFLDLNETLDDTGYVDDHLLADYGFTAVLEVILNSSIILKPSDSILVDADIVFELDGVTSNSVIFSILPDVPGDYIIELYADDGRDIGVEQVSFTVLSDSEGVVNVTFE